MPSGDRLVVKIPRPRSRSGSYSSQYTHEPNHHHNSIGSRDFQYRGNNHRGSVRNPSISYRAPNYSGMGDHVQASSNSSDGPSPSRTPLTEGFQAQLQPAQSFPVQHVAAPFNSSLVEVVQHQAAINRFPNHNHTPLSNTENYSNTYNKENSRTHGRNHSNNGAEQPRVVMSQGSHNRKENSPMKKGSTKSTPFTSPKKDSSRPQGGDNNQKGHGSKNKKKGNKQSS